MSVRAISSFIDDDEDNVEGQHVTAGPWSSKKLDAALTGLTSNMAHDFNNLLAVILSNLEMMEKETTPKGEEYRMSAIEATLGGASLVRAMLAFAREQHFTPTTMDINAHLARMTNIVRRILGETIELSIKMETDLWSVHVDAVQLESAIISLATNARDAMREGGTFTMTTKNVELTNDEDDEIAPGPYVCIEATDNGCGMPPEIMTHIFEPFFTTKDVGNRSGFGLAVVYGFIRQSHGHVIVKSRVGGGSTFSIFLPRSESEAVKSEFDHKDRTLPMGHGETVLVVEDNPDVRHVLVKQLESLNYKTIEAINGRQALEILDSKVGCNLLMTDILMPGDLSGYDVARNAWMRNPSIHIILTSGFSGEAANNEGEILPGIEAGFLGKPYRKSDLAWRLHEILTGQQKDENTYHGKIN